MTLSSDSGDRARLSIQLVGPGRISLDGRPVALRSRKAAALLYYLAAHAGDAVTREALCDLLWSRVEGEQARASLRQALSQIRRALPPAPTVLRADQAAVTFDPASADIDLAALRSGDLPASADEGLLTGLPNLGEPFDDWRQRETARVTELRAAAGRQALDRAIAVRDVDRVLALAEVLLATDPGDEETHTRLIRFHLDRGALGAALKQYERCRKALMSELGVPPSDEIESLHAEIRERQESRVRAGPDAGAARGDAADSGGLPVVAVASFADLGDGEADAVFARIFAADLTQEISRFRGLRVIAPHSLEATRAAGWDLVDAARRLGARYLLGGSVRRAEAGVRVSAEIMDVTTRHVVWTQRFADRLDELPALEDALARAVAGALAVRIDEALLREARPKPLGDLNAYDCWLRGVDLLRSGRPESHTQARLLFKRALEIDTSFARAYAGLSLTHFNQWTCHAWADWPANERYAHEYASIGVGLDDTDHVTQFILGRILLYRRDFARAEQHLRRAEMLNPNDADTVIQIALGLCYLGAHQEAADLARRAVRLNPFHDDWYFVFTATPALMQGRYADAVEQASRAPEIATDQSAFIAIAQAAQGLEREARRSIARFRTAFERNITFGRPAEPDEPARWFFHVNPFRRPEDRTVLAQGLRAAGLTVPEGLEG
ncbi:MAG: BTAD domain-containing putative transcriptional regulator [Azospirillaceae bacterium]